ncbi:Formyltransferase [Mytilinidion resinicola]|uniref:methionyl-tRNA formyltransferase n=1 Tax=Mytilinidion resinicola TaxID=574789 RepID=A0A6A6YLA9_9PEZI|nr:Formyltransferase [Mytilinidion resinicola]KAF2809329.1 Formyltransferase [Mytilinidion resinicola]
MNPCWRLRLPVRSFRVPRYPTTASRRFNSSKTSDPLRILFCGSDDFSIASLRAVHAEHLFDPGAIASIDVVHRPGKLTGRGLKQLREVPIKKVAQELKLPTHEIDTFTGWTPPSPQNEAINLIIAVSFGKLVPPRILNGAKYGGLNVHPSLLPDFRGPAPIHYTLLAARPATGLTIQTLHPTTFDAGLILAQTPAPGLPIPNPSACSPAQLTAFLAPRGGALLVDVLRRKLFVPPLEAAGWYAKQTPQAELRHAPMITKEDGRIRWERCGADELVLRRRVLENLWTTVRVGGEEKRLVIHGLASIRESPENAAARGVGEFFACKAPEGTVLEGGLPAGDTEFLAARTVDGGCVLVTRCTVEGGKRDKGAGVVLQHLAR